MSNTTKADSDAAREYYETHSTAEEIAQAQPGEPITSPMSGYSVRLPTEVLNQARAIAAEQGMTTGAWLREAIEKAVTNHTAEPSDSPGAVPIAELLALIAKHQDDERPDESAPRHRSAAEVERERRRRIYMTKASGVDWVTGEPVLPTLAAATRPYTNVWAELDKYQTSEPDEATLQLLTTYRNLLRPDFAQTLREFLDIAYLPPTIRLRYSDRSSAEIVRANKTKRQVVQPRAKDGRRRAKS